MYATFNYIGEIEMTKKQAENCSHSGDCEMDVLELMKQPKIKRQLKQIDFINLKKELKEYGAWDEQQLSNHEDNLQRIVWIAACDISEEIYSK